MSADKLNQLLSNTPSEISPERDLWPKIATGLKQQRQPSNNQWAIAASLLIGIIVGGISGYQLQTPASYDPSLLEGVLQVISEQHQQRLAQLPSTNPLVPVSDLQALRTGADQLQQGLLQQPDNQALLELWLWTQQRELELLQTHLPQQNML